MSSQLHDIQSNFTAYLRDPDTSAHPSDVPLARMRVYEDLVFRNISSLLTNNFPVVAECTGGDWNALMRGFIRDHRAQAPHFPQLPLEFLAYLDSLSQDADRDEHAIVARFPFIAELAHYEWVELDVQIAPIPAVVTDVDPIRMDHRLVLNPTAHVLAYGWPVHQIGPAFLPLEQPQTPTFLAVFLSPNAKVEFMSLTPLAALLLENIDKAASSVADQIKKLSEQFGDQVPADLTTDTTNLLDHLRSKGLVYATTVDHSGGEI